MAVASLRTRAALSSTTEPIRSSHPRLVRDETVEFSRSDGPKEPIWAFKFALDGFTNTQSGIATDSRGRFLFVPQRVLHLTGMPPSWLGLIRGVGAIVLFLTPFRNSFGPWWRQSGPGTGSLAISDGLRPQ